MTIHDELSRIIMYLIYSNKIIQSSRKNCIIVVLNVGVVCVPKGMTVIIIFLDGVKFANVFWSL